MRTPAISIVLAATLALAACGGEAGVEEDAAPSPAPSETEESPEPDGAVVEWDPLDVNFHDAADVSGRASVALELDDFYFEPTVLFGERGQTLSLRLTNDGTQTHTFTVFDQEIDESLLPDATTTVEVTIPREGVVVFVCRFHDTEGMRGAVAVPGAIEVPDDDLDED